MWLLTNKRNMHIYIYIFIYIILYTRGLIKRPILTNSWWHRTAKDRERCTQHWSSGSAPVCVCPCPWIELHSRTEFNRRIELNQVIQNIQIIQHMNFGILIYNKSIDYDCAQPRLMRFIDSIDYFDWDLPRNYARWPHNDGAFCCWRNNFRVFVPKMILRVPSRIRAALAARIREYWSFTLTSGIIYNIIL